MTISKEFFEQPLGPHFSVRSAREIIGFDEPGWVITHLRTGLMIWTGAGLTMRECADRLLDEIYGKS